jgi:hypothetical protein
MITPSLKKIVLAVATVATVGAASLSTASAGDYRYSNPHYGYAPRYGYHAPVPRHDYGPPPVRHHRRDRTGEVVAGAILGLGAVIVGAAIVDAARHGRRHRYDD